MTLRIYAIGRAIGRAAGLVLALALLSSTPAAADTQSEPAAPTRDAQSPTAGQSGPEFIRFNARRGRQAFVEKGCVICHTVNRVGGMSGPSLNTDSEVPEFGLLDFAARMWRGAKAMTALQERDIGYRIDMTGQEIADIAAFLYDPDEQKLLKDRDIPVRIRDLMRERNL